MNSPILSICIPTYNRSKYLKNCLNSIIVDYPQLKGRVQICVSDNASSDDTLDVVLQAKKSIDIDYCKNESNLGIPQNFLNVVRMARGEFVWLVGDDDLMVPGGLNKLIGLLDENIEIDFFYVNAFHLDTEYLDAYPNPFDTRFLPAKMEKFSTSKRSGRMAFLDLIDPSVSFDFLGGMFLSVFRREMWRNKEAALSLEAIADRRTFSHFDNTFPHVAIFAEAFSSSQAYFNSAPLIVSLSGARDWAPMEPMIRSVRLLEALDRYRANGLPLINYLRCRNYTLGSFASNMAYIVLNKSVSGYEYVSPCKLFLLNMYYPNTYLSVFFYLKRKLLQLIQIVVSSMVNIRTNSNGK